MPVPIVSTARLRAEIDRIREILAGLRFGLTDAGLVERERALGLINRYLEPRLAEPSAPLLVAVFGPTGSGKSTLVNSIAGRQVGEAGVLRPTTRRPLIWCHRSNADRYSSLSDVIVEADDHPLNEAVSIVDTPDLDSYLLEHRIRTEEMLDRCDAVIFVTTPQRYADSLPWETLARVLERKMALLVVANRLNRKSRGAVADLASLLRSAGHGGGAGEIVAIQEQKLRAGGLLPATQIKRVDRWLSDLAPRADEVTETSVQGTARVVLESARIVIESALAEVAIAEQLSSILNDMIDQQVLEVAKHLDQGDLVRAEVVARWQRLVGVTDLAAVIGRGWARAKDLISGPIDRGVTEQVERESEGELFGLVEHRARLAFRNVAEGWRVTPGANEIADSADFDPVAVQDRATRELAEWRSELIELVGEQGQPRFRIARAASIGVNAAATILLVAVFAQTGGLTGAEVGVVAGAAAAQQTVLEHVFGSAAASQLARQARRRLVERIAVVISEALAPLRNGLAVAVVDVSRIGELERSMKVADSELARQQGG